MDTSLPELQHNVRLLVEFAEAEIQSVWLLGPPVFTLCLIFHTASFNEA